ncbi:MAG: hypothetical protein WBQ95_01585 [Terracidiphilus sp.]
MHVPRFSFLFTLALLSTWAGFTPIATAQSSPETTTSTSSPVAYVYVQTKKGIDVFSASSTGRLTPVKGSLFADTGQMGAINGHYLVSVGTSSMHTYPIEANGAVGKQAFEVSTVKYDGSDCGTNLGGALFDHTGKYVYVLLSDSTTSPTPCSALQSYKIESNGDLTFLGEAVVDNGYHGESLPEGINTISGNDTFAYGVWGDIYTDEFDSYRRESGGALMTNGSFSQTGPTPNPAGAEGSDPNVDSYFPLAVAADPADHLAAVVTESFAANPPPPQLASFTINSNGSITSTNSWNKMPTPSFYPNVIAMSWTGKQLAVAGKGIEIFNFNGAAPMTLASSLPLTSRDFDQLTWDRNNHLYALDYLTGNLYVYTVSGTTITAAPGSPYAIPDNTDSIYQYGLIVVPK